MSAYEINYSIQTVTKTKLVAVLFNIMCRVTLDKKVWSTCSFLKKGGSPLSVLHHIYTFHLEYAHYYQEEPIYCR